MLLDSPPVRLGRVSFIVAPGIIGVFTVELHHIIVPVGFGKDGGRSDREEFSITFDDAMEGELSVRLEAVAIDQQGLWLGIKLADRPVHSQKGGIEDVDLIEFLRAHLSNSPCKCFIFDNWTQ